MHTYEIEVERDGRWYMIHVPEIVTQARHSGEIEQNARELVAVSTSEPIDNIAVVLIHPYAARVANFAKLLAHQLISRYTIGITKERNRQGRVAAFICAPPPGSPAKNGVYQPRHQPNQGRAICRYWL